MTTATGPGSLRWRGRTVLAGAPAAPASVVAGLAGSLTPMCQAMTSRYRPGRSGSSVEEAITAAITEVSASRPVGLQHRRLPAPIAVGIALALAAVAVLISVAASTGSAGSPSGHRTGTQIGVPHPAPGPFGS